MKTEISELVNKYADAVFRLITRIIPDRDDAYDLTQELFIKIVEKPKLIAATENVKGYLLRSAYNSALNFKRDQSRRSDFEYQQEVSSTLNPEDNLIKKEQSELFKSYLGDLSQQQRDTVMMRFYGGMKFKEIAQMLKINEATVRVHLQRGLDKLKKIIVTI